MYILPLPTLLPSGLFVSALLVSIHIVFIPYLADMLVLSKLSGCVCLYKSTSLLTWTCDEMFSSTLKHFRIPSSFCITHTYTRVCDSCICTHVLDCLYACTLHTYVNTGMHTHDTSRAWQHRLLTVSTEQTSGLTAWAFGNFALLTSHLCLPKLFLLYFTSVLIP